ncbi:7tm 7 domain containing protein [Asbolus verrucosus]|uniref:7tm 7 domain containing protein n=1 Tax=Asbolus verrucosus TaxID=1661398 RepID=A0A482VI65_ASBVE|nr:7tm 7 domain containing protein [Asbolus verrucosus]
MLLSSYQNQSSLLAGEVVLLESRRQFSMKSFGTLELVKNNMIKLKRTVDLFNDIFGWSIFFNIFFCSLKTLDYLDNLRSGGYVTINNPSFANVSAALLQIVMLMLLWVMEVFYCDAILKKFDEIFYLSNKQEAISKDGFEESYQIDKFVRMVGYSRPRFTAARFFSIDRTIIFSALGSITTFLIVIIQLKLN